MLGGRGVVVLPPTLRPTATVRTGDAACVTDPRQTVNPVGAQDSAHVLTCCFGRYRRPGMILRWRCD